MPTTPNTGPGRRAAAADRCTPRRSRGTLKDGRCRPEPCGVCSALRHNLEHRQALFKVQPASLHKAFADPGPVTQLPRSNTITPCKMY